MVLYFYPKDNTPGCTTEACDFRDEHAKLQKAGAVVLGVSPDSEKRHSEVRRRSSTCPSPCWPTPITPSPRSTARGARRRSTAASSWASSAATFLIGPDGKVKKAWPKVKVAGHVDEVLAAVKS